MNKIKYEVIQKLNSTGDGDPDMIMEPDVTLMSVTSWKEILFGKDISKPIDLDFMNSENLVFSKGDILKFTVDGILMMDFLERI